MDRLSIILSLLTGSVITGIVTVGFFTLGIYSWGAIAIAVVVGFGLAWPAAYLISRRIKRREPGLKRSRTPRTGFTEI